MRSDQLVATVKSRVVIARGIQTSSISYSVMKIKPWQRKRGKPLEPQRPKAALQARVRAFLQTCKIHLVTSILPTRNMRVPNGYFLEQWSLQHYHEIHLRHTLQAWRIEHAPNQ